MTAVFKGAVVKTAVNLKVADMSIGGAEGGTLRGMFPGVRSCSPCL